MVLLSPDMAVRRIFSVGELTEYLKALLDSDRNLRSIWVRGEISNYKHHSSGHIYFTLKDETSTIKAVMFRSKASQLAFRPEHGMRVVARGYVTIFPRDGQYQLYVEELEPDGLGSLHLAFEQLKKRLEAEGLFDVNLKKSLPPFPRRLGIVTSPTGAAVQDMLNIIRRRYPKVHIILVPVAVQGEEAPGQIAQAVRMLNDLNDRVCLSEQSEFNFLDDTIRPSMAVDVIIVGRGGGSLEELWAFNTEAVARAIFASHIPVVSAVGHETDFTIADFVADLRAPTPSAAAELVVPDEKELLRHLDSLGQRLFQGLKHQLHVKQKRLELCLQRGVLTRPKDRLFQLSQHVDSLERELTMRVEKALQGKQGRLAALAGQLQALSPLATLSRGYTLTLYSDDRRRVTGVEEVRVGQGLTTLLTDGEVDCTVTEVRRKDRG
ncbi:MAG: exodeoxyribonuclease VII large subunit [Clostridia bacterium]|nr:exodeoxyribonuclease VII large subunit [Clostridia bacterium]